MLDIPVLEIRQLTNIGKKNMFKNHSIFLCWETGMSEFPEQKERKKMSKGKTFCPKRVFFLSGIWLASD